MCIVRWAFPFEETVRSCGLHWNGPDEESELMRGDSVFYMSLYRMPAPALQYEHEQAL